MSKKYYTVKWTDWKGNSHTQIFDNENDMLDFMNQKKKERALYSPPTREEFKRMMGHN